MASLTLLLFMLGFVARQPEGTLDFVSWYSAASIVRQGSAPRLYDLNLQREVEERVDPQGQFLPFDHLPLEAWMCLPLALFSFPQAYLLWSGFNLALLGLILYLIRYCKIRLDPDSRLVWLPVTLPPVAGTLVLGQDSLVTAVAFLLMYVALRNRRDLLAGLALGLGLEAFQIALPFAFIFLLRRRWKFMVGFSASCAVVLSACAALVGGARIGAISNPASCGRKGIGQRAVRHRGHAHAFTPRGARRIFGRCHPLYPAFCPFPCGIDLAARLGRLGVPQYKHA